MPLPWPKKSLFWPKKTVILGQKFTITCIAHFTEMELKYSVFATSKFCCFCHLDSEPICLILNMISTVTVVMKAYMKSR